ncbi:DUF882 domain-containing protein [Aminobacter carboxidus]|uniref:Murein endopeptidase K n=1 Tax=Aminobacter carboxidus TaxID=376165 RepID=A0A8E1WFU9_9HYPH|nr:MULTISPECIES: DUF882 domain-containing protein [Aminobacter carboxidus group]MBB6467233.1 uncharacterized protein YcbK (DUF882 family) [Aminobacter lissarensis]MBE1208037.1 DUF882 domain-containing protein [Aminobacter carboxidus]
MLTFGFLTASQATASAETRTLKLYYTHTGERAEITFKRNGRYDAAGLKKLNQFLRDWRRNEPTKMDPRLFDVVWEAYRSAGARDYIHVVSAYRSPATNSLLRSRSSGVAEKSQHMLGKAMDFFVPGVPLKKLRDAGLRVQAGGVGYYPRSGSPFIHMDVGNVRHWPRMSRKELVAVFPSGKTLHVPSDGKPLPGFEQALASYQSRKASGDFVLASAAPAKRSGGLFAALFGGGADEEEDTGEIAVAAAAPKRAPTKAIAEAPAAKSLPGIQIVAPENAQRAELPQVADEAPDQQAPETIIAALPARSVPLPGVAPRPQAEVGMATAENVPFGAASVPLAEGEQPTAVEQQIAANVPLPTWRPNHTPPAELKPESQNVLMALASTDDATASDLTAPLPSARPQDMTVEAALAAANDIPAEDESGQDELEIASLAPQPEQRSVFDQPETVASATPKNAIATASAGTDPAAAVGGSVKTTRKSARPMAQEAKPEPKPVVVAAAPDSARWALRSGTQVTTVTTNTKAPGFAYNMVRTAPTEVYTSGFQQGDQAANAHKFSGSAVKFLSVARFSTN